MGVAKRIVRNQHDAEDAFQATFLALASRAEGVRRRTAIAGWLYRTAVRAARAVGRKDQRWQKKVQRKAEQMESLGKSLRHEQLKATIDEELEKLPSKYRTAVVLCDLEGKTLGLFGFGRTGRATAQRALGFGVRLLACDPYITLTPDERARFGGIELVSRERLLR